MAPHEEDLRIWRSNARKGDGSFAIALAILHLAEMADRLGFTGPTNGMGALEFIGKQMERRNDER